MKTSFFRNSVCGALVAGALLTAPACSDVEQDEMFPITVIGELSLADSEGYALNTNDELPVVIGTPVQLHYSFSPEDATRPELTFSTADPSVATVSSDGLITGVSDGQTTLTVAPAYAYSTSVAIRLNVVTTPTLVSSIEFVAESVPESFFVGQTAQLAATSLPADATFKRLAFSSLDEAIATVTPEGLLTGVSKGTVIIRCSATDGSGVYADHELFVDQVIPVQKADLVEPVYSDPTDYAEWAVGESCQLTYTMEPANASAYTLQWSSSNPDVATVTDAGKVIFLKGGTVAITLTCPETGYTSTVDFTVGEGLLRYEFDDENNLGWVVKTSGAVGTWHPGYWSIAATLIGTKYRGDIGAAAKTLDIHIGKYPILAMKISDFRKQFNCKGNIKLDMVGDNGNNKYTTINCDDTVPVYYYDLTTFTTSKLPNGFPAEAPYTLSNLQFKIADIENATVPVKYNIYWIRTFKSVEDLEAFVKAHPEEAPSF